AVAFQPRGLANNAILSDAETAAAFAADRAELTKGSSELRLALEIAEPFFIQHLARLNSQLGEGAGFLFGDAPTIADFSTYHCLWFVHNNEVLRQIFAPYPDVNQWMSRMAGLGQAEAHDMSGKEALAIAKDAVPIKRSTVIDVEGPGAGDDVEVMPIDYGFNPVAGKLRVSSFEEIVLARQDEQLGQVAVHFPRLGFEVRRARA
ncbi:MAG: glutathione S-transferase C-terminal domain-containing protein, partial [Pseudomonadales bacterium]